MMMVSLPLALLAGLFLETSLAVAAGGSVWAGSSSNMNGDYALTSTPNQIPGKFPTNYGSYPGKVEFFDVYSPVITSTYAEIVWKTLETVPLPSDIVKRFAGKPMAVIGLEWDQVRKTPAGDVSVPMNVAYNHHYGTTLLGADSTFLRVDANDPRVRKNSGHGPLIDSDGNTLVVEDLNPNSTIPNSQAFFTQNGGEARLSFKGFSPGYARPIMSPEKFSITVMQIDTWERDKMNLTGPTPFVAGPLPRRSLAKKSAPYSGLLECPMTTRVTKELDAEYFVELHSSCSDEVTSESECAAAVSQIAPPGFNTSISIASDPSLPGGCSFAVNEAAYRLEASFNTEHPTASLCGRGRSALIGVEKSLV